MRQVEFTQAQAEVLAEVMEQQAQIIYEQNTAIERLKAKDSTTKGDVRESELRLQKEIEVLRGDIKSEIKSLEIKLMLLYGVGFVVLLGILAKGFHWF